MEYHEDERWMTIKEAAGYIGVSTSFLRKHLRRVPHAKSWRQGATVSQS